MEKQTLTDKEIREIKELCFSNPVKACAKAQIIIDTLQVKSCPTYAEITEKSPRHIQYIAESLLGINIEKRKFISLIQ